jgi:hypothetical protein
MTTDRIVLSSLLAELTLRQLPCGGWAALASSSQPTLEPTCFAALALGSFPGGTLYVRKSFFCARKTQMAAGPPSPAMIQMAPGSLP